MKATLRALLAVIAVLSVLVVALLSVGWWAMHTAWFLNLVRSRLAAMAEQATGGRVEIGSLSYDMASLSAQAHDFVIHGKEPTGDAPLLRIKNVEVGLKILSLWKRDFDFESLTLDHPEVNLRIGADGTNNIPGPKFRRDKRDPVQQLMDLRVKHLAIRDGVVAVNDRQIPLNLSSNNVAMALAYRQAGGSYDVTLALPATDVKWRRLQLPTIGLSAQAQLFRNSIQIESLQIGSKGSSIKASGTFEHFNQPTADLALDCHFDVNELTALIALKELQNGTATARGSLHFDSQGSQFTFRGRGEARNVNYISKPFTLRGMNANGQILANNEGMSIERATASARGAEFAGAATIRHYRLLKVEGNVSHLRLSEVGSYLTDQPFPWSGVAAGTAFASASLTERDQNFIIGAQVQVTPDAGAIPVDGTVGVTYLNQANQVQFSTSHFKLPHSELSFDGDLTGDLNVSAGTTNMADFMPIVPILGAHVERRYIPSIDKDGRANFKGSLHDLMGVPSIRGDLTLTNFAVSGQRWENARGNLVVSERKLDASFFELRQAGAYATGAFMFGLVNWMPGETQPFNVKAHFGNLDLVKTAALFTATPLPVINGLASGSVNLEGTLAAPKGSAQVRVANLDAYSEPINQIAFEAGLDKDTLHLSQGRVEAGAALLTFSGDFQRTKTDWSTGELYVRANTNGFPLASLTTVRKYLPSTTAQAEAHFDAALKIDGAGVTPLRADGTAFLRKVSIDGRDYGEATLKAVTQGTTLTIDYSGKFLQTGWHGRTQATLIAGTPVHGDLRLDRLDFATLKTLVTTSKTALPVNGFLEGGMTFDGSLQEPEKLRARLTIDELQIGSAVRVTTGTATNTKQIVLRNKAPIVLEAAGGVAVVRSAEITGDDTSVQVSGEAPYIGKRPLNLKAVGKANLQVFSLFDSNVQSSGTSEIAMTIGGTLTAPTVAGALQVANGSVFMNGVSNGLSSVNGTVVFSRNRATIQKMTARSGGGDISLSGFVSFGPGTPVVYHVEGFAQNVRVRYANSISVTANSDLRLSGTSTSSILSGNLTVSRVVFTPNADIGTLLAAAGTSASASGDEGDFLTGLHLDISVESAPNLQVSTNLSHDIEAEIQLRLRGTPDHPILLGSIAANQGDLRVFGTRYTLNRGEVNFVNTVRAEPVLDLDLETQTRGVTVDITISGTLSKLNFNYRSDPPLQPRDIIALLTVGRAPGVGSTQNSQTGGDFSALKSGVSSVVGQAISPVSSRLSRLFGITNIRIDPFVQGITNTPQARLSVEQQISRDITITYITNLSQTSEQIFRLEWALNRQFSVVALRDDNGEFGLDFQYKRRFK